MKELQPDNEEQKTGVLIGLVSTKCAAVGLPTVLRQEQALGTTEQDTRQKLPVQERGSPCERPQGAASPRAGYPGKGGCHAHKATKRNHRFKYREK